MSALICECVGDGQGGHHPFCEQRPKGVEVRGFIGMNGRKELCFFPDSRAEGVPVLDPLALMLAIDDAPARRVSHDDLAALDPPPGPAHDCDAELRAGPGYHPGQCKPDTFQCSCGIQYGHVCDEAEGCWWEAMTP